MASACSGIPTPDSCSCLPPDRAYLSPMCGKTTLPAAKLYEALEAAGLQPWLDAEKLLPGQNWRGCIERAIDTSDFFIACFSSKSVRKRGQFPYEVRYALRTADRMPLDDVFMLPVRMADVRCPSQDRVAYAVGRPVSGLGCGSRNSWSRRFAANGPADRLGLLNLAEAFLHGGHELAIRFDLQVLGPGIPLRLGVPEFALGFAQFVPAFGRVRVPLYGFFVPPGRGFVAALFQVDSCRFGFLFRPAGDLGRTRSWGSTVTSSSGGSCEPGCVGA